MMQVGRSRRTSSTSNIINGAKNGVITGSIRDNRMKFDELKSGLKVINGEENSVGGTESKKKENSVGNVNNGGDNCGSRVQVYRRLRRNQSGGEEIEKNRKKWKSEIVLEGIERNSIQLRKTRSDGTEKNSIQLNQIRKTRSEEAQVSKEIGVIKEKTISISSSNVGKNKNQIISLDYDNDDVDEEEDEGDHEDELVEEKESEGFDDKEVNIEEEQKPTVDLIEEDKMNQNLELVILPMSSNVSEKEKSLRVKEVKIEEQRTPKRVLIEDKKFNQIHKPPLPKSSKVIKKALPIQIQPLIDSNLTKLPPSSIEFERYPESQNNLQNLVDLIMWKDVSKSTFVFGLGTFVLLSSSFTKDLNFSLISAISYMGLLYLASIFLYKSILCRGAIDIEESRNNLMVGEEEAIWLLKLILPYLNEFLMKLRNLFSGDPETTMKLAVLLFVLARCGSSITIWKLAKLGFFGVFTLPKICSSYSTQLTGYGKFWVRRFGDAWDSCSHKKAVAFAMFTLIWNMSSIVSRIWAVFMLFVAVRYYQQSLIHKEWEDEEVDGDNSNQR